MALSYFGNSSNPADNGSNSAITVAVVPPASMQTGDLAIMVFAVRHGGASPTVTVSTTGGQTWTAIPTDGLLSQGTEISLYCHWATFNGTWSGGDPAMTHDLAPIDFGIIASSLIMLVFRPTYQDMTWDVDGTQTSTDYTAPGSPFTVTVTTRGTGHAQYAVSIAFWCSQDDNTWGSPSGDTTNWNFLTPAQFRNTAGSDLSVSMAYNFTNFTVGSLNQNQLTLGGDAGCVSCQNWYMIDGPITMKIKGSTKILGKTKIL